MEIKREYDEREKIANFIREKAENNREELENLLLDFNMLSNVKTKEFLERIEIGNLISHIKENHIETMINFKGQLIINNESFKEVDEGIGKDLL